MGTELSPVPCRYDAGGAQATAAPLTDPNRSGGSSKADRRVFVDTIREEALGTSGQPAYVQVHAALGMSPHVGLQRGG